MSDNVGDVKFGSGMVENVGVAVEIALPFVADVGVTAVGRRRAMSAVSYSSLA